MRRQHFLFASSITILHGLTVLGSCDFSKYDKVPRRSHNSQSLPLARGKLGAAFGRCYFKANDRGPGLHGGACREGAKALLSSSLLSSPYFHQVGRILRTRLGTGAGPGIESQRRPGLFGGSRCSRGRLPEEGVSELSFEDWVRLPSSRRGGTGTLWVVDLRKALRTRHLRGQEERLVCLLPVSSLAKRWAQDSVSPPLEQSGLAQRQGWDQWMLLSPASQNLLEGQVFRPCCSGASFSQLPSPPKTPLLAQVAKQASALMRPPQGRGVNGPSM